MNLSKIFSVMNKHVMSLNSSKYFAGIVMILLNVGSKFISIQFSKSTEEYLKMTVSKQILVFSMAWLGTRDIYTALGLTAVFVVLSDHLFNEDSHFCVVPQQYRVLNKLDKLIDTNGDGVITENEINNAVSILEKARRDKNKQMQKQSLTQLFNVNSDIITN
jgi:hypothetical protein